jgi:HK97 family phage portal protein
MITTSSGDPWNIPSNGSLGGASASGVSVTEDSAMRLVVVAAAVRILSDTVAGLPFDAVRASGGIHTPLSPQPTIMGDPFGGATSSKFATRRQGISQLMVSLLLRGNGYGLIVARDGMLRPSRIRVIHPDRVKCEFNDAGEREYEIDRKPVSAEDVVHLIGMSYPDAPRGISVIAHARNAIGLGLAAEEFGARFFGDGAHMTGIVEVASDMTPDTARSMKEAFTASHGGLQNSHTVGVLSGGAQWKSISVTPEDAQFLGTRQAQNLDIAMLFGVPPHMLGQVDKTTSWGTGIEQQGLAFLAYTINAWLGRFEDAWGAMLPKAADALFDRNQLLRTDEAGRYAVYASARAAAIMTTNEIRARENLAAIEGGDDIAMGLNSTVSPMKDTAASSSAPKADALGAVL